MKDDLVNLKKENAKNMVKFMDFILDINKHPFTGIGKPEALKGDLQGWWSRRITEKHRLVYRIKEEVLEIMSCYGHYGDK
jgi:toxin YoeB